MPNTEKPQSILELSQALTPRVQIEDVLLTASRVRRNLDADIPEEIRLHYKLRVSSGCNDDHTAARIQTVFTLIGVNEKCDDDEAREVFKIEAEFTLFYRIKSFEELNDSHIQAFGKMNGVFNAWPYWREFVQSSVARISLPPVTVPVLTAAALQKMYETKTDSEGDDAAAEPSQSRRVPKKKPGRSKE